METIQYSWIRTYLSTKCIIFDYLLLMLYQLSRLILRRFKGKNFGFFKKGERSEVCYIVLGDFYSIFVGESLEVCSRCSRSFFVCFLISY